ncbi:MAG: hypothetical protein M3O35_18280 [Acidobacteriota bacterium]|nr:hypothetical protein [Acidobacteriota bacterium]
MWGRLATCGRLGIGLWQAKPPAPQERFPVLLAAIFLAAAVLARAELAEWVQHIPSPSQLQAAFFRTTPTPILRPPKETRAELARLITASPTAELYALRAREDEQQLDFSAAESDWKEHLRLATDKPQAQLDLADFYHRRLRPPDEITALEAVGQAPSERLIPPAQQRAWHAFERILTVVSEQALPVDVAEKTYRAWIARYPKEPAVYRKSLDYLESHGRLDQAAQLIADYSKAFPDDAVFRVEATATLAWKRGSVDQAVGIYDQSFRPLWPPELVKGYFDLLKQTHALRRYLELARAQVASKPTDLVPAARIFYYYQQQGNLAASQRALLEYRSRKDARHSAWTPDELRTIARLFSGINNYDESARAWYSLYSLPNAADPDREEALAEIARLLLTAPEQPVQFGSGDLSLYRDIATLDPYPGFLNGILSLLLNSATPRSSYDTENRASAAYFHRARASELIQLFDTRFAKSEKRPELHALLIRTYATYGDNDGLLRAGREYLTAFPNASDRAGVATAMADAYARTEKTQQEFAVYDELLKELAQRAEGVPIGDQPAPARSPEYARILDRYISRLVSLKRLGEALALIRREIDRNPDDPGLYERLAAFLEQNKLDAEMEAVYRKAMAHFQDPSWSHKLARWYLRHKQNTQFEALTREVIKIFSGTQLEAYVRDAAGQKLTPVLYRQVNLYAHQRFPNDLVFVNNLLTAYVQKGTASPTEYNALLRRYWYYDPSLRERFFEHLSSTKTLDAELAAVRGRGSAADLANANPAAVQFVAEAESWRSHFEDAAPAFRAIAGLYPAANMNGTRAASIYRSLATYDPPHELGNTRIAAGIEQNLSKYDPRDHVALTRSGEIYADRELYARSRPFWNKIAETQPGSSEGYLESATVFWDYFLFDDALRQLADGRRKLNDPALYAYEAGAIHENRREYAQAIEEYARGVLAPTANDQARQRLLALARRPRDRTRTDELTARETAGASPSIAAVSLRADVLSAQNRRPELQQFLDGLAARAGTLELAEWVDRSAASNGFDKVQQHALEREVALSTDPVERMRKRLDLARFLEGRGDTQAAGSTLEALIRDNPAILGVVRATVDFYWRNKQSKPAIDLLIAAAGRSQPAYKTSFTFEAARKSADSGQYARARTLLDGLLQTSPYSAEYLTAYADTFAREGKDQDLRDFYTAKIKDLRAAPLDAADRTEKTAALRRGLILVLTRMKDYTGAMDQYIEVINRYPEDEALTREAAVYAFAHGRAQQLSGYYAKTSRESPKDYRWPMVEARVYTQLEDFPAAIDAWKRAIEVRPDRVDLYTSRAGLEERLLRFDEAAADYAKLYELNYHNGHWMEKVAEARARQGKNDEGVAALRIALIEGRPQRPDIFFDMAARLESWNLLNPARESAEKGVALAGSALLTEYASGARQYAHIMTRLRRHDAAWKRLSALPHSDEQADAALRAAQAETGAMVAQYFTPEEKSAFAAFLAGGQAPTVQRMESLLPVVAAARLSDVESDWRYRILRSKPADAPDELVKLAQRRLRYADLGTRLEALWKAAPPDTENRDTRLQLAVNAYRLAGDAAAELRVLTQLDESAALPGDQIPRFAELLSQRAAQRLVTVAASDKQETVRDGIANYVLDHGAFTRALDVIAARGRGMPPVWTPAYTGLTGVWFAKPAPQVSAAFRDALGIAAIGDRLGKPVDRDRHLAGDIWFSYGTAYGEYLGIAKEGDPDDYLPALLEASPARSGAYFELAEIYRGSGRLPRAQEEYENALQLDATRADAHERLAGILWDRNQHDAAIAQWKAAVEALSTRQDRGRVPPDFWQTAQTTFQDIGKHNALAAMRPETDRFLKNYVRRNGTWQVDPLLRGAVAAAGSDAAGIAWILELARAAPDTPSFLSELVKRDWIPDSQRLAVYRALIDAAQVKLDAAYGDARASSESELRAWQIQWIEYLIEHKQIDQARKILDSIPEQWRAGQQGQVARLEVRIAAQSGTLPALLGRYAQTPESAPDAGTLRNAANELIQTGNKADANRVLEYVYQRELDTRAFAASTFLGLAEIRLQQNDTAAALALLRRMTQVAGEPFANLVDAASLLETYKHSAEAVEFLDIRVRAVPWDGEARMRLGRVRIAAGLERDRGVELLRAVALSNDAAYDIRANAARALGEAKAAPLAGPSAELILLASATIAPVDAEKPYFYDARVAAAKQASDATVRMRLLTAAAAIRPEAWEPKRDLFRAAFEAKRYQTAIAALFPLMIDRPFTAALQQDAPPEPSTEGGGAASDDESGGRWYADQFLSGLGLQDSERASLARSLAQAYQAPDRTQPAGVLWRMARQLDPSDATAKRQVDALAARAALARQNALRRPVIKAALEQDHLVQPRLGGGQ